MTKYFTENKEMYFEVTESEYADKYLIYAFSKDGDEYRYERNIPEDIVFDNLTANTVAQSLSWVFEWGVETTKYTLRDELIDKIQNALKE